MKWNVRHLAASTLMAFTAVSPAAVVTSQPYDLGLQGAATLTFSQDVLDTLSIYTLTVAPYGWAYAPYVTKDQDGNYSNMLSAAPINSLTWDNSTNQLLRFGTTGGVTLTVPQRTAVSSGGSLTVTDLDADLSTKTVYATIIGTNGVGTISHLALWTFSGIGGSTSLSASNLTLTNLAITIQGFNAFRQSLGLLTLGKAALAAVTDYGTLSALVNSPLDLGAPPPWYVSSLPEPSTYAFMGLGLVGIVLSTRRARRH